MDFSQPRKSTATEAVLPMINVVFLLLIFFMMTTQIAPKAPFAVAPPHTDLNTRSETAPVLFLAQDGRLFFEGDTGDAAFDRIARMGDGAAITLRADAQTKAVRVAQIVAELRARGITQINLVGQQR